MATKIRRCLYIGLGGTGMTSLLHTKRMFIDTYGEVPPMIGFLGIDTDGGVYSRELQSKCGPVRIDPNEQMPIIVNQATPIYQVSESKFTWVPEENLSSLTSMNLGAGAIRSNGRFALTVNYDKVVDRIKNKINEITNARIIDNNEYELLSESPVEIHMVFSIAGGTGSGTFINMAYLLKDTVPDYKIMGYAVLPDVFEAMYGNVAPNVKANGYGAIMDLDWFMHRNIGQEPFTLQYLRSEYSAQERPFNSVVFINSQNKNNDTYDNVEQLAEMISLGLVTSAGALSVAAKSVNDNLEKIISDGNMDIDGKVAWAAGMGASEILFRGSDLGLIYALKSSNYIIENLLNSCVDTDVIVNNWIDQMQIRENNGSENDQVIDFILPRRPQYEMSTINEAQNALAEANGYVDTQVPKDDVLQKKLQELKDRVEPGFRKLMIDNINTECGVGSAEKILQGLTAQFDVMLNEMENERAQHQAAEKRLEQTLLAVANDLAKYDSQFIKVPSKLALKKQDVMTAAVNLATSKREILRRNKAIEFFTFMKSLIMNEAQELLSIRKKLEGVYRDHQNRLASIQNRVNADEQQLFQIDLAQKYVGSIAINNQEINFTDLFNSMPEGEKLHGFGKMSNNEVSDILMGYTTRLNGTKKWTNMSLNDVLKQMDEDDFSSLVKQALRKSLPLFTYDTHGYIPQTEPTDIIYVGIPTKNCRINKTEVLKHIPGGANVDAAVIGMSDRIIMYRQLGVVPAFTIASLSSYQMKYEEGSKNYHIDANLQRLMQREQFSLWPSKSADNSLELWVNGFIFGLIKNENNCYWYKDTKNGDPLFDFWIKLSQYRDDSFNQFRSNRLVIEKQFEEVINLLGTNNGTAFIKEKVDYAKEDQNYLNEISQINMTLDDLTKKGMESIRKLITDEINYVKKELGN
jgi:hypothetical protein